MRLAAGPRYAVLASMLVVVPVVVDLLVSGRRRVFGYLAADAFYYLTVGRNWAEHGVPAFDQTYPTNGYHPLWQAIVAGAFKLARLVGAGDPAVLLGLVLLDAAFVAAALLLLVRAMRASDRTPGVGLLTLPVGAYALAISPLWRLPGARAQPLEGDLPLFGTLWADVNGMETGLLLLVVAVASCLFVSAPLTSGRRAVGFGATLAALTLARLDHVFFALALLALRLPAAGGAPERRRGFAMLSAFAAPILAYFALNRAFVGTAFPVSGALKSSFPHPSSRSLEDLLSFLGGDDVRTLGTGVRQAQMVLPALVGAAFLILRFVGRSRRSPGDAFGRLLEGFAIGTLLLATYGFWFVRPVQQWHWYYPVSTLFVGLVAARGLDRLVPQTSRAAPWLAVAIVAASIVTFVTMHRRPSCHRLYADFYYDEGPALRARYAGHEPRLVEYDDGIVAFTTGFPTMSGTGLNLDPAGAVAHRERRLLPLALARGFDRITSFVYARGLATPMVGRGQSEAVREYAKTLLRRENVAAYDFSTDYYSERSHFAILRITLREGTTLRTPSRASSPSEP